jgi:hypothetical protein
VELGSQESSTSSAGVVASSAMTMKTMPSVCEVGHPDQTPPRAPTGAASAILDWAKARGIRRRRADGDVGLPDEAVLRDWATIIDTLCPPDSDRDQWITAVMNNARNSADSADQWRNWSFLTLQVQLAAERTRMLTTTPSFEAVDEFHLRQRT